MVMYRLIQLQDMLFQAVLEGNSRVQGVSGVCSAQYSGIWGTIDQGNM